MRKKMKKGAGEVLAFLLCLPIIFIMIFLILDVIRIGSIRERLEYTAYKAARAAVVCKDMKEATQKANEAAYKDLLNSGLKIDLTDPNWGAKKIVKIQFADGKGVESKGKSAGTKKGSKADKTKWEKGNFIICQVTVKMKTILTTDNKASRTGSVVMMIEETNDEDGVYPWFKGL